MTITVPDPIPVLEDWDELTPATIFMMRVDRVRPRVQCESIAEEKFGSEVAREMGNVCCVCGQERDREGEDEEGGFCRVVVRGRRECGHRLCGACGKARVRREVMGQVVQWREAEMAEVKGEEGERYVGVWTDEEWRGERRKRKEEPGWEEMRNRYEDARGEGYGED